MSKPETHCRLYLITPPAFDVTAFRPQLEAALDAGDVACVQLRLKAADGTPAPRDVVRAAAEALCPLVQGRDVAFLINDDADLAREVGADGVHVGQDDMSVKDARAILGTDAIVGATCHASRHLAMIAAEQGADYVAFGAFFPTNTKQPKAQADPEILSDWSTFTTVPCVAIGGVTVDNCAQLVRAGADFLAVVGGVWDHPDGPAAAVKAFNARIRATEVEMDKTPET